jgi:hypothetical protein
VKLMQVLRGDSSYDAPQGATETPSALAVAPWLAMAMVHDNYPTNNAAEADPVQGASLCIRSPQGQAFRNAILRRNRGVDLAGAGIPQDVDHGMIGIDSAGSVVREMSPLYNPPSGTKSHPGYRDLFGAFAARAAFSIPIIAALRYKGQLPLDQQPIIKKPNPWDDPTRGSP